MLKIQKIECTENCNRKKLHCKFLVSGSVTKYNIKNVIAMVIENVKVKFNCVYMTWYVQGLWHTGGERGFGCDT